MLAHVDDRAVPALLHARRDGRADSTQTARTMTAYASSCSAMSGSSSSSSGRNPALLTRMSTGFAGSARRFATRSVSFGFDRSAAMISTARPVAPQLGRHGLQSRRVAGDQDQVVPARRELPGELGSDAGRATGDQSDTHVPYDTVLQSTSEKGLSVMTPRNAPARAEAEVSLEVGRLRHPRVHPHRARQPPRRTAARRDHRRPASAPTRSACCACCATSSAPPCSACATCSSPRPTRTRG